MRVCVVGNGPSARGHGREIDACDFVVRLKGWWAHAAEDAGSKIDAWVWFGDVQSLPSGRPHMICQHWYTHCPEQTAEQPQRSRMRWEVFRYFADGLPQWQLPDGMWKQACDYLHGTHPSVGFIAVHMAMHLLRPESLLLAGFDSTTPDAPNYAPARVDWRRTFGHDFALEKQMFAAIRESRWMGDPTKTRLEWIGEPEYAR